MTKQKDLWVVGYEYRTAHGEPIRKVIVCESLEEYKRIVKIIEDCNSVARIDIAQVLKSTEIK